MTETATTRHSEIFRLAGACAGLLLLSVALGIGVNLVRPEAMRLAWVGDWDEHIETRAFRAGIPVAFLAGTRERLRDEATVVFDARTPSLYAAGHLPGAKSLPLEDVDRTLAAYSAWLTMETPILVYCDGANCSDSLELAIKLREYGFENLTLYPGGFAEWTEYGGGVHTGSEP